MENTNQILSELSLKNLKQSANWLVVDIIFASLSILVFIVLSIYTMVFVNFYGIAFLLLAVLYGLFLKYSIGYYKSAKEVARTNDLSKLDSVFENLYNMNMNRVFLYFLSFAFGIIKVLV